MNNSLIYISLAFLFILILFGYTYARYIADHPPRPRTGWRYMVIGFAITNLITGIYISIILDDLLWLLWSNLHFLAFTGLGILVADRIHASRHMWVDTTVITVLSLSTLTIQVYLTGKPLWLAFLFVLAYFITGGFMQLGQALKFSIEEKYGKKTTDLLEENRSSTQRIVDSIRGSMEG